jgi:hypothetical protein
MSKRKAKINRSKRRKQLEQKTKKRSKILPVIFGLCTVLGFSVSLVVFLPRPTVSPPSVPFDKNDKFSVSFNISNNGYIPLEDCTAMLGIGQILGRDVPFDPSFMPTFKSRFVMPAWQHHYLGMDDRFTVILSDLLRANVQSADIAIIVSYKPWFFPLHREKIFRFVTFKGTGASQYWRSWPVDEPLVVPK